MSLSQTSTATTGTTATALLLGAAAILAFYAYGRYSARGGKGNTNKDDSTNKGTGNDALDESLDARIVKVIKFLRQYQIDGAVDILLHKYYKKWAAEVVRADGPAGATGVLRGGTSADATDANANATPFEMTSAEIALTMIEALGGSSAFATAKEPSALKANDGFGYTYTNDMVIPDALAEEVITCVPPVPSNAALLQTFTVAEAYNDLCQTRRVAAAEGRVAEEETYAALLRRLWDTSYTIDGEGGIEAPTANPSYERQGAGWGDLGFQGHDPFTDLRGGGLMSLEDYVSFAEDNKALHKEMVAYNRNQHATSGPAWFLEACVSIQLSVQLTTTAVDVPPPTPSSTNSGSGGLLKKRTTNAAPAHQTSPLRFTPAIVAFLYTGPAGQTRHRLQRLHALYFKAFFALWQREKPFIMEYQNFMTNTYYPEASLLVERYLKE